jgi:PAS domain-containing protein
MRCLSWVYEREKKAQGFAILNLILRDASRLRHKGANPGAVADLMALIDGMDECAYRKDRNHVITLANRNFRRMLSDPSKEPRDLTGLTDYDLFSEEYADQSYELEEQVLAGQPVAYVAQQMVQGRKERLDHRKFPVWDQGGQITGLFTIIAVTTERVLAERALRANEDSLKGAQKNAGMGTFVLDIQEQTWTVSDVLYEILGIDKGCERTLAVWTDLIREEDLAVLV